jgi:hypothetical protein
MSSDPTRQKIRSLDAAYAVGGREALAKMNAFEVYVLYLEKAGDLKAAKAWMKEFRHDELGPLRHEKARREMEDIAGYMKERFKGCSPVKDRELER